MGVEHLDGDVATATMGAVLKDHDDLELARGAVTAVVASDG
jgi:hypothetical protein